MNISLQKTTVLTRFKIRELLKNKTFWISAILVPLLTLGVRLLYQNVSGGELPSELLVMVLNMGVTLNLTMISIVMTANMLAKEKEKNTLRVLMTSSVSNIEYFISAVIPTFLISFFINILVLLISGLSLSLVNTAIYLAVSGIAGLISCILGMIVGLYAKDQMGSSNLSSMICMVLLMIPMFSSFTTSLKTFSDFMYTGVVRNLIDSFVNEQATVLSTQSWLVLGVTAILAGVIFVLSYRKNGFARD